MSETVILIMLTVFYSIYALENGNVEVTKLIKHQNIDINLFCGLTKRHEEFNRNISITWYFLKVYNSLRSEEWRILDSYNGLTLTLDDSNVSSGYYMCKMFPYRTDRDSTLQIEITKTFKVEISDNSQVPPPELFESKDRFGVEMNSQVVLSCKCKSTSKPTTIKWFKLKANNSDTQPQLPYQSEIKYFENFYQPLPQVGLKLLDDNIYLSKLTISNVTEEISVYVCVALNYSHKFSYRNFTIIARRQIYPELAQESDDDEEVEVSEDDDKTFELFFIPLIFLLIVIVQMSAIVYLLIYRRIMWKKTASGFE